MGGYGQGSGGVGGSENDQHGDEFPIMDMSEDEEYPDLPTEKDESDNS